jgi:hypothetical protein
MKSIKKAELSALEIARPVRAFVRLVLRHSTLFSNLCVPKTLSGDDFGFGRLNFLMDGTAFGTVTRFGAVSGDGGPPFARPRKRTARTDRSESSLVLTGFCPGVGHGCQNHLEQYQWFASGSNPATPINHIKGLSKV